MPKPEEESEFRAWYSQWAQKLGLHPDPDNPEHYYDWRAAWRAGATPDESGHWPSKYKLQGHPTYHLKKGGSAGPELPLSFYDRPSIALANLVSGDVDATTAAIFAPMTLSPTQIRSIRQRVLANGGDKDPILKTIVDLATNPIVIVGLIMTMGPWGKVASVPQLHKLWTGGGAAVKGVAPYMRPLLSPFTAGRDLWQRGFLHELLQLTTSIQKFRRDATGMAKAAYDKFVAAGGAQITPEQEVMVDLHVRGFHKIPRFKVIKGLEHIKSSWHQGYYKKHYGVKMPLMAGLEAEMKRQSPALLEYSKDITGIYAKHAQMIRSLKTQSKVVPEFARKGVDWFLETYSPRILTRTPLERLARGGLGQTAAEYKKIMGQLMEKKITPHLMRRVGNSIPLEVDMALLKDVVWSPGMKAKYLGLQAAAVKAVEADFRSIAGVFVRTRFKKVGPEVTKRAFADVAARVEETIKGANAVLLNRLESHLGKDAKARAIAAVVDKIRLASALPARQRQQAIHELAQVVGAPARFIVRTRPVMQHYINSMAPTFGWHLTGHGEKLQAIAETGRPWFKQMFMDDLGPMLKGFKNFKEYARSVTFKDTAEKFREWLITAPVAKKLLPADVHANMVRTFSGARGGITESTIGGQIASLLYTSALGLNISPVSKNLMQNWITTLNVVGPVNMARGLKRVGRDLPKLPGLAKKLGSVDKAIEKLFPEYYHFFGGEEIAKAMAKGDIAYEGRLMGQTATSLFTRGKQVIMAPFAGSEKFNRLLSFYAGYQGGITSGLTPFTAKAMGQAAEFGALLTQYTQFPGGVAGIPQVFRGVWTPFRQFGHFPLRFVEFLYGGLRMGPTGGFTTGVLGRGLAGSAGIYTIARNLLKMDISGGLMFGALPGPVYEGSAFYPSPYVPPILGMAGDVVKALHTGEYGRLGSSLALGVPAGLATRRAWRTWHPKYADYTSRTPEGRIPVYNDKGMLISTQSPMELTMRGLGLHPTGPESEREATKYLLTQREKIRSYRRSYIQAIGQNDLERAEKIQQEFQKKYPELGALQIKKSDIQAEQKRKETTRMHRILKGFPKAYQPLFQSMIEHQTLTNLAQGIDMNPERLETLYSYLPPE